MSTKWSSIFRLGIVAWLILNLVQAAFLPLDPDEAYYWMYAQQLDWGYFDHPPMVAILVNMGSSWLSGPLGVRLGSVLVFAATLYSLWHLAGKPTDPQRQGYLLLLAAAMPIFQVYGFVATPDSPLLLFTVLFFLAYQQFLEKESWGNTGWLSLVMALLLYSKYHGILVIFFTLLSNLKLLTRPRFYLASFVGACLFSPHLYWQYIHDFPTFRYHLIGRNDTYELKYTLNYLMGQLLVFSPFLLPFLFKALRQPPKDALERSFYFVCFGFWSFFLYSSFNGNVEPHWTAVLSIPIVILLYRRYVEKGISQAWVLRMASTTLVLLLVLRIALHLDLAGIRKPFQEPSWVTALEKEAGSRPVVFISSYRDPSIYSFYSGSRAYTYTDNLYRPNQYDIWEEEEWLHGQEVLLVGPSDWEPLAGSSWQSGSKNFMLSQRPTFQVTQKLQASWNEYPQNWQRGDSLSLELSLYNPYRHPIDFSAQKQALRFVLQFDLPTKHLMQVPLTIDPPMQYLAAGERVTLKAGLRVPALEADDLLVSFCLQNGDLRAAYVSPKYSIRLQGEADR